jgi:hypothetical protein
MTLIQPPSRREARLKQFAAEAGCRKQRLCHGQEYPPPESEGNHAQLQKTERFANIRNIFKSYIIWNWKNSRPSTAPQISLDFSFLSYRQLSRRDIRL